MTKKNILLRTATLILLTTSLMTSCKEKEEVKPSTESAGLTAQTVKDLPGNPDDGSGTGHYTFFNFKNNAVVPLSDSATTKWDIAFNATTIIINSGISGPGNAAGQVYTGIFSDLAEAPANGYRQDTFSEYAIVIGTGNGWYNYNSTTHVISAIPGRVLVFKTTEGNYVKMEIINYYKGYPANPTSADIARYYTFRYTYQADGSRTLK